MNNSIEQYQNKPGARDWLLFVNRFILGGIFVFAGLAKMGNPGHFSDSMSGFKLLHSSILLEVGMFILWLEAVAGVLLVAGAMSRASAVLLTSLLIMFLGVLSISLIRGLDIDCSCFAGLLPSKLEKLGPFAIIKVIVLGIPGILAFRFGPGRFSIDYLMEKQ
jgi:uncharacterized membrane protein YphA (DoxX/SURF4 family)